MKGKYECDEWINKNFPKISKNYKNGISKTENHNNEI